MVWVKVSCEPFHGVTPELLVSLKEKMTNHRPDLCLIYYNSKKEKKKKRGVRPVAWLRLV